MIRAATLADCETLAQLDARCNPSAWSAAQFQAACTSAHDTVLISENDAGELLGFIVWQTVLDEMELHLIATSPEHRRRGVASQLLTTLFQTAQQQAITRILLEVRASNTGAQQLYTQYGFIEIARRKHYYAGLEDAVMMEKVC